MVARERIFGPFGLRKWDFIHSDRECFDTGVSLKADLDSDTEILDT